MEHFHVRVVRCALILEPDKIYADALRRLSLSVLTKATVRIAASVDEAQRALATFPADLLITGVGPSLAGDGLDFIAGCTEVPSRLDRVLVVTTHREHRQLMVLRQLPVQGVFDSASESCDQFVAALRLVAAGGVYWSRTFLDLLHRPAGETHSLFILLTAAEQLVLAIVGDGSDDAAAARELGLSPATISTVRRNLHRKLGVQHRGELVRIAAQTGFVRFTPAGVIRPGFGLLEAACRRRHRSRKPLECLAV